MNAHNFEQKLENCDWKNFEKIVSNILKENNYLTKWNVNKTLNKNRRQYDVVAEKYDKILLIECKKWSRDRYKKSHYKKEVEKHLERSNFYKNFTKKTIFPLMVSCYNEDIKWYKNIPIIPCYKLNSFVNNIQKFTKDLKQIK